LHELIVFKNGPDQLLFALDKFEEHLSLVFIEIAEDSTLLKVNDGLPIVG
jgi:hypothetical protein